MSRFRLTQFLMGVTFLYLLFISFFEIPVVFRPGIGLRSGEEEHTVSLHPKPIKIDLAASTAKESSDARKWRRSSELDTKVSGLVFDDVVFDRVSSKDAFSEFHKSVRDSFVSGRILWEEIKDSGKNMEIPVAELETRDRNESCPDSLSLSSRELVRVVVVPCGLTLGSHITVVGKPRMAHPESDPKIGLAKGKGESVMVSQFVVDLQGLKVVDGEDPPRILHLNPRLKGDWSGKPVIEHNTCYRMQWGTALRCQGWKSKDSEDTVDGQVKCEKWIRDDDSSLEESRAMWWLNRLLGKRKKIEANWPFPFAENKLFVMTITAGLEGFHVSVDGRHVTSFPYRTGFTLEDATGLSVEGDIDVQSVYVSSLPASHPNVAALDHLEMLTKWQAPLLPDWPVDLFIGILSAGTHFAERMATRKSWMQQDLITSSNVVARFFVALHKRKEVNLQLMKEAEFFGDIVIVPYMDNYDLVVLKTIAICEYGVRTVQANYIMKCDDDTFVRLDAVMLEMKKLRNVGSLYAGNMNYYHRPLRHGKWAVKYEEWPEEAYPPYANGPGYIVSSDIAQHIVSEFEQHKLRIFKMEDVSMGMWVERFSKTNPVEYVHNLKFCQFGCVQNYLTAHYQSPRQMICLWSKLQHTGKPECCNMR